LALKVNETFHSIQGESSYAGYPCVFVRLTGCNLRCSYCDTQYAYYDGDDLEIEEILNRIKQFQCHLVEVTGGEPLFQTETPRLIHNLLEDGFTVLLETNGSLDISLVDSRCIRIVDIKCPTSGEAEHNDTENLDRLTANDELKFVIGNRTDYVYAKDVLELLNKKAIVVRHIHFSPVFGEITPEQLASWILEDHLPVRLSLQMHKIIWHPDKRGV
jgi:7-carboxy-7-deazaguanine synthase